MTANANKKNIKFSDAGDDVGDEKIKADSSKMTLFQVKPNSKSSLIEEEIPQQKRAIQSTPTIVKKEPLVRLHKLAKMKLIRQLISCPLIILVAIIGGKWFVSPAEAQCPVNTMTSFERISGVTVKDSLLTLLYTAPNISSSFGLNQHHLNQLGADLTRQLTAASGTTSMNIPITAECNNRCRRSAKCRAFLVDYGRHTCYSIEHQQISQGAVSATGLIRTPTPIHLIPTQERTSYFEKVCLNLPTVDCERAWIYERVLAYHVYGHDDKIIEDVPSRLKCQEHCLNEREFRCRSGEYDYLTMQCRLSMTDRHLKPTLFRPTTSNVDYFENQCVSVGNQCDAFDRFEDMDLGRSEIMRSANTSDQCQQFCTQTIKAFICRSYTWNPLTGKCYLNSANSFMVGGLDRLINAPGLTYYQRNDCIDLRLECDTTAMTLNLRTNEPFRGRMYVRDDPNSCETLGRSSLTSSLSIPFQSHARCATRELPSRYSSVVVVQQHPLIQRKSDRYIKVVCDFQTANKTITSTYNVVANPWTSTALINATSFAPKIKLRITDKFGVDITGAKLGDELYLRIEAETESVYDMVARSVLAKSGTTDESIVLIDKDGCPTDFRIFPPLKKLSRRTIVGKFDAFKFSSDVVVRFQVDVQFCLNQCPSTSCDHNLLLNSDSSQLADAYNSISLAGNLPAFSQSSTTTSSTTTQASSTSMLPSDPPLVTVSSSTQSPPAPFQQQQQRPLAGDGGGQRGSPNGQHQQQSNYSTGLTHYSSQEQPQPSNYYHNSATLSSLVQAGERHLSVPANHPMASMATNYSGSPSGPQTVGATANSGSAPSSHGAQNLLLESMVTTSDPQIFESSQPRGANSLSSSLSATSHQPIKAQKPGPAARANGGEQRHRQQLASNSIDSVAPLDNAEVVGIQQSSNSHRRRRRSAEPMPTGPRHVPLQREIIVIESSASSGERGGVGANSSQATKQRKQVTKAAPDTTKNLARSNGPAYNLNGNTNKVDTNEHQALGNNGNDFIDDHQNHDGGTLLCTTKNSLVLATVAFCSIQFLTILLCLVTWLHRTKETSKFKVKHPVEERLY